MYRLSGISEYIRFVFFGILKVKLDFFTLFLHSKSSAALTSSINPPIFIKFSLLINVPGVVSTPKSPYTAAFTINCLFVFGFDCRLFQGRMSLLKAEK